MADVLDPVAERAAFLAERRKGIGGSDVACVVRCDPRKTRYSLWREKVGLPDDDDGRPAARRRGNYLEAAILRRYAEAVKPAQLECRIAHEVDGWRRGNQDARATMSDGTRRTVEAKSVTREVFRHEWGRPWSDEIPDRALCQGLWYANLDRADLLDVPVLVVPDDPDEVLGRTADEVVAVSDFHVFQAPRHARVEEWLVEEARAFWHDHVLPRVPPELEPLTGDVELRWPTHAPGAVKPVEPVRDLLRRYARVAAASGALKRLRDELRERLLIYAEEAEALVAADGKTPLLTMRLEHRSAYQAAASSARTLRLTKWFRRAQQHQTTPQQEK